MLPKSIVLFIVESAERKKKRLGGKDVIVGIGQWFFIGGRVYLVDVCVIVRCPAFHSRYLRLSGYSARTFRLCDPHVSHDYAIRVATPAEVLTLGLDATVIAGTGSDKTALGSAAPP